MWSGWSLPVPVPNDSRGTWKQRLGQNNRVTCTASLAHPCRSASVGLCLSRFVIHPPFASGGEWKGRGEVWRVARHTGAALLPFPSPVVSGRRSFVTPGPRLRRTTGEGTVRSLTPLFPLLTLIPFASRSGTSDERRKERGVRPRSGVNGMGGSLRTPCLSRPSLARRETGDTASEPHPIHLTFTYLTYHIPSIYNHTYHLCICILYLSYVSLFLVIYSPTCILYLGY